jgi:hypothetical protein
MRQLPEPGSLAFTPTIAFVVVFLQRLWLALAMAPYVADVLWTLLMMLGALGYAALMALAASIVDGASRRFGPTMKFGIRVFGAMFVLAAYLVSQLLDVVFAFLPLVLLLTGPLVLTAALLGVASGIAVAGAVQLADAWRRRLMAGGA